MRINTGIIELIPNKRLQCAVKLQGSCKIGGRCSVKTKFGCYSGARSQIEVKA